MLVGVAVYVVFLSNQSYHKLNDYSVESSTLIFQSVFQSEHNKLGKLAIDYSVWNEAVAALTDEKIDYDFLEENFLGSYMKDAFNVERIVVFDSGNTAQLSIVKGEVETSPPDIFSTPPSKLLIERALATNLKAPDFVTGVMVIGGELHLIAVSVIAPNVDNDEFKFGHAYGVLMLTEIIDQKLLANWSKQFRLHDLQIQDHTQKIESGYVFEPMLSPTGKHEKNIVWRPDRPGEVFIGEMLPTVTVIILFLTVASVMFSTYVNRYIALTINESKLLQQNRDKLNQLAHFDSVTNLPNRVLGMDRLGQALKSSQRMQTMTAVLFIDLDGFKQVNDTFGHGIGDDLLHKVGKRLEDCVRIGLDTVSRLGGDEFIIILTNLNDREGAVLVAEKITDLVSQEFIIKDNRISVSASTGIAITSSSTMAPEFLVKRADEAMYVAKSAGKNQYRFSDEYGGELTKKA
ncbi:hypothetical protein A9Q78_01200 [Methylophaga sp. 41_12_T18]|nr:hypothetical protein A9Q78_01200 [Methylophaga sp. 41_12_T18]